MKNARLQRHALETHVNSPVGFITRAPTMQSVLIQTMDLIANVPRTIKEMAISVVFQVSILFKRVLLPDLSLSIFIQKF